jgi:nitroimidazol reductase NimA-like FMN-containing flavoprotein (pyridoxamine 5'-phosphate oxidase superfamily)
MSAQLGDGQWRPEGVAGAGTAVAEAIVPLTSDECWAFLATQQLGRLAATVAGVPDIFPVNYLADQETILFRTGRGTKLLELTVSRYVAFEVDRWDTNEAMSVVVRGMASVVEDPAELAEADLLALHSWVPTETPVFVRVRPVAVSGRRITLAYEPPRSDSAVEQRDLNRHPELYLP